MRVLTLFAFPVLALLVSCSDGYNESSVYYINAFQYSEEERTYFENEYESRLASAGLDPGRDNRPSEAEMEYSRNTGRLPNFEGYGLSEARMACWQVDAFGKTRGTENIKERDKNILERTPLSSPRYRIAVDLGFELVCPELYDEDFEWD